MKKRRKINSIILASKSPRRKEIMQQVGLKFEIMVSDEEEKITQTEPSKVVVELSMQKAEAVYSKLSKDEILSSKQEENQKYIIIAADTVVAVDDVVLGKPIDRTDAYNMINAIQGKMHSVLTGITVIICNEDNVLRKISFYEKTNVEIYNMTESEINRYIDGNEPYDKAGGYAIQGEFASYVKRIEGDYYNVVGLPIARIIRELKNYNIDLLEF